MMLRELEKAVKPQESHKKGSMTHFLIFYHYPCRLMYVMSKINCYEEQSPGRLTFCC